MPGTFSPPPRVCDPGIHHGTYVTHMPWCMLGSLTSSFLWSRWWEKRSRHSRRMRKPQFYVSGKTPIVWKQVRVGTPQPLCAATGIFQNNCASKIPWSLTPWLLVSPGRQRSMHWLCNKTRSFLGEDFNYLRHARICFMQIRHVKYICHVQILFKVKLILLVAHIA